MIRIDTLKFKFPNNYLNKNDNDFNFHNYYLNKNETEPVPSGLFPVLKNVYTNEKSKDKTWGKYYDNIQASKSKGNISYNPETGEIKNESLIFNKCNALGLKSINVGSQETVIELSAKILKEDYYDLININNFDKVIEAINNSGEIEVDPVYLKYTAQILKVDITNNIELNSTKEVLETVRDLGTLATGRKFRVTNYEGGYEIVSQCKTDRERLIIYPKLTELEDQKKINKELAASGCDFTRFENTLRIESNLKNFNSMRKYFKPEQNNIIKMSKKNLALEIPGKYRTVKNSLRIEPDYVLVMENKKPLMLADILQSDKNINYLKVNNMYGDLTDKRDIMITSIIDTFDKVYKIEKFIGQMNIIKYYDYDINLIRKFLKSKMGKGSNISSYLKQYEYKIKLMRLAELNIKNNIENFFNKLKEAA